MAIIYGKAISIGYSSSKPSGGGGGLYSIWLTIPAVATSVTFTAVKGDVSVASTYISNIGAAKITLPETDYEGDWTVSGTVGGKTASQTVTVTSDKNDYFVDMRNDFIPLSGELKVGNLVTFDDKSWRVVHQEGTHWYLASENIVSQTAFGSSNVYKGSTLAGVASTYESEQLSTAAKEYCVDVTVENVTGKVFVPTYAQCNGGFEYYNSNANRICTYDNSAYYWLTSSPSTGSYASTYVIYVLADGGFGMNYNPPGTGGFRPHICIKYYPNGFDFTYTGTCNIRDDGVVELLTSGDFVISETTKLDAFLVGGGASGESGNRATSGAINGGAGGGGGYTKTALNTIINADLTYPVVIGAGGASVYTVNNARASISPGENTIAFNIEAAGATGIAGGSGGGARSVLSKAGDGGSDGSDGYSNYSGSGVNYKGGTGQGTSTREFGEATGKLYAGGGGGSDGVSGSQYGSYGLGGEGGGGNGILSTTSYYVTTTSNPGTPNTGGGGGGAAGTFTDSQYSYSGAGGSGIVCLRLAKSFDPMNTLIEAGEYTLNDTPTFTADFSQTFKFKYSGGTECTGMKYVDGKLTYFVNSTITGLETAWDGSAWSKDAQKTIIISSDQGVSKAFYKWFKENTGGGSGEEMPLVGSLAVGNLVTYDDKSWRVVHNDGTKWYLASETIIENTVFGGNGTTYANSTIANKCTEYLSTMSELAQKFMVDITIEAPISYVTNKVFIPTYNQLYSGLFSYYVTQANRIAKLNGTAAEWWTSTFYSNSFYYVKTDGSNNREYSTQSKGFRPHICIDTSLSGSATKETVLNGTYVFNANPTAPTEYPFIETVPYKYGSSSGGTYQSIRFYQDTNTKNLCMYYHYSDTTATAVYNFSTKKWLNDTYRTIIFDKQTVSESFYDWFIANTTLSSSATKTLSGTWTFNDTVNAPSTTLQQSINFTAYNKSMIYIKATPDPFTIVYGETASTNHVVYNTTSKWNYSIAGLQKVTFTSEQEVSDEFYEWFTANATGGSEPVIPDNTITAGTWKFKDIPATINGASQITMSQIFNFQSNNKTYGKMSIMSGIIYYHPTATDLGVGAYNQSSHAWSTNMQTIILSDNQTVSEEFYTWFIANATKQ